MEFGGCIYIFIVIVVVLLEVEEVEIDIYEKDVCVDIFVFSGFGGQSVNIMMLVVCLMYLLIGVVVFCQDEKLQIKNKEKVMKVLCVCVYDKFR